MPRVAAAGASHPVEREPTDVPGRVRSVTVSLLPTVPCVVRGHHAPV